MNYWAHRGRPRRGLRRHLPRPVPDAQPRRRARATCSRPTSCGSTAARSPTCSRCGTCTTCDRRCAPRGRPGSCSAGVSAGLDLLVPRRLHRLLRPRAARGDQRARACSPTATACTTTPRTTRRPTVHRLVADGTLPETHCTDDGVGLVYRGTELVEAVSEVDGKGAYVVHRDRRRRRGPRGAPRAPPPASPDPLRWPLHGPRGDLCGGVA